MMNGAEQFGTSVADDEPSVEFDPVLCDEASRSLCTVQPVTRLSATNDQAES